MHNFKSIGMDEIKWQLYVIYKANILITIVH